MELEIAVLLTCHNRKEKTLQSLNTFIEAARHLSTARFDVFLVDDGSTDGTGDAVQNTFPDVHLINGNGNLFWNQGMRLAWQTAVTKSDFDFYIWLNDDVALDPFALVELMETYTQATSYWNKEVIVTGCCRADPISEVFSYGGRTDAGPVIPDGSLQLCRYINGNFVLVPNKVFKTLGNLSDKFTHAMGDFDYGLRAQKHGIICAVTRRYIGICLPNQGIPRWCDPGTKLRERWKSFRSPRGLNVSEYLKYQRTHFGTYGMLKAFLKSHAKMFFPRVYNRLK